MMYGKFAVVVVLAVTVGRAEALAHPSTAQAEVLFRHGRRLLDGDQIAEACAVFDASQKLDPTIATVLNQGNCRERNGQLATAWGLFLDAERRSRVATDPEARRLHRVALEHAARLESRLSMLAIVVPPASRVAGLEIWCDAEPVDAGAWNQPLPVDGASYEIAARADGFVAWSTTVIVGAERDTQTITIPRLAPGRAHASQAAAAVSSRAAFSHRGSSAWPIAAGGVAIGLFAWRRWLRRARRSSARPSPAPRAARSLLLRCLRA
jgi:hypothetical protein